MSKRSPYALAGEYAQYVLSKKYAPWSHARLMACQADASPLKRRAAANVLIARSSQAVFRDSLELCRNDDPRLREQGVMILGRLHYPDPPQGERNWTTAYTTLHALAAGDPRAVVRAEALRALAHCGASPSVILDAEETGSRDASPTVRVFAAYLIGRSRHEPTVPAEAAMPAEKDILARLLQDTDKDVRDWAAFAVYLRVTFDEVGGSCDSPAIREALLRLTDDPHEQVRFESMRALGALREKRAVPALIQAFGNEHEINYDLAEAAGNLGDPALIPVLEKALERFEDSSGHIREALERLRGDAPAPGENHHATPDK